MFIHTYYSCDCQFGITSLKWNRRLYICDLQLSLINIYIQSLLSKINYKKIQNIIHLLLWMSKLKNGDQSQTTEDITFWCQLKHLKRHHKKWIHNRGTCDFKRIWQTFFKSLNWNFLNKLALEENGTKVQQKSLICVQKVH